MSVGEWVCFIILVSFILGTAVWMHISERRMWKEMDDFDKKLREKHEKD